MNRIKNKIQLLFIAAIITAICSIPLTASAKVQISSSYLTLIKGTSANLSLIGTLRKPEWTSSRRSVASVTPDGQVLARNPGRTIIKASIKGKTQTFTYTCRVQVLNRYLSGENNSEKIYHYLQLKGFTPHAAAGVVGNLMYESGGGMNDIKLNAVELATGRGVGMCQWTDTKDSKRRTYFVNYCKKKGVGWPNNSLSVQVMFLMRELYGYYGTVWCFSPRMGYPSSYKMSLEKYKQCTNVATATAAFCANFERPYYRNSGLKTRITFSKYIFNKYK